MLFERESKKPPSLLDLSIRIAIDNVRYFGYVGGVDFELLDKVLPHCTAEQLTYIEDRTLLKTKEDRIRLPDVEPVDLTPITNKIWKRLFERQYGAESLEYSIEEMNKSKVVFKWRNLYEAKAEAIRKAEEEAVERLKERYKNEDARKQSRQMKICAKAPPTKRPFWGNSASGYNVSNVKSNIMKKAKIELLKSREVKNLAVIKRNTIQKSFSVSSPKRTNLSANAPSSSRSMPYGERKLPPKRIINYLPKTAPSTLKNAASRGKHVM